MPPDPEPTVNEMQATFRCPACEKQYPALPTLVGRPVRCSGCKQVFALGAGGVAELVVIAQQPAVEQASAERPAPQPPTPPPAAAAAPETPTPNAPSTGGEAPRPQSAALKAKHDRIRAALRTAAESAAGTVPGATAPSSSAAGSSRRAKAAAPSPSRPRDSFAPVAVAPQQDRTATLVMLGLVVVPILVIAAGWLALRPSTAERALARYEAPVPADQRAAPERHRAILDRSWLRTIDGETEATVVLGLDQVTWGQPVQVSLSDLHAWWRSTLQGLVLERELCCWIEERSIPAAKAALATAADPGDRPAWVAGLRRDGHQLVAYEEIPPLLSRAGLSDPAIYAVSLLLGGSAEIGDPAAILASPVGALELLPFTGIDGRSLHPSGDGYTTSQAPDYWGLLLKAPAGSHPLGGRWRVLVIHPRAWSPEVYSDARNPLARAGRNRAGDLRARPEPEPVLAGGDDAAGED